MTQNLVIFKSENKKKTELEELEELLIQVKYKKLLNNKCEELLPPYSTAKSCTYIFLVSFGSLRTLMEGFIFFKSLCDLIPGISGPLSIVISSICAVINLTFYYTFDLNLYREGLNFVDKQNNNNEYIKELNIQLTQIKICKELYMHFPTKLTSDEEKNKIAEHGERINLFTIKKYPSSKGHKAAKIFIYSFGALSTIGGEFFFIKSVLDYLFPMLLLSPGATLIAAYIIIPISILWALVEFKLTSGSGIDTFIYPEKVTYQKLETELSNFKKEYDEFYSQYNRPPLLELQPTGT